MKMFMYGLMLATGLGLAGCAKSFHAEVQDVRDAEKAASEKVRDKERELQDTKMEEGKKIMKERRDVEDAANREATQTDAPVVVP
jgi:hypothetical protein